MAKGKGCTSCFDSGFKGRLGLYELLEMSEGLQSLILTNPSVDALQGYLRENGHKTLRDFGYDRVKDGLTTIEEVQRVTTVEM
jgi:type IV pilus assembly protein PilB